MTTPGSPGFRRNMDDQEVERRLRAEADQKIGAYYITDKVEQLTLKAILVQLIRMTDLLESVDERLKWIDNRLMYIEGTEPRG